MSTDPGDNDRGIFLNELSDFLPAAIFDVHAHLFRADCFLPGRSLPPKNCCLKFGKEFTLEQYLDWAAEWLPGIELRLNSFGLPLPEIDRDACAAYTGRISDNKRFYGMALIAPRDSAESALRRLDNNRLVGFKPYLNYVDWKPVSEVTIHDMLPAAHMRLAEERGLAIILHIPRPLRLADPLNQVQMTELCRRYPNAKIVFAHIGRAYYLSNVTGFLDGIAACPNAYIDTAMVNHEGVLEYAFRNFPRDRILFGSDAPIAMLRGKSVEINNQYAYLMGEDYEVGTSIYDDRHAVEFTTFYYEQLRGIKLAAVRAGLSPAGVEDIMCGNARRLFDSLAARMAYGAATSGPREAGKENAP